jgi:excisionase family DNA binding protein
MTNTETPRPSAAQLAVLLILISLGGTAAEMSEVHAVRKIKTRAACRRNGWIIDHDDNSISITPDGILAATAADQEAVKAAYAEAPGAAADRLGDEAVAVLAARGITLSPAAEAQVRASAAEASAAAEAERGPVIDGGIPDLMSMTEVAALHGVSRQAVHKAIMSGKLPARRAGSTWVIRREVVEQGGESILIDVAR